MKNNEQQYTITSYPSTQWSNQYGTDLRNLYGRALRKSLRLLCRECLWGLSAVSLFYGMVRLAQWLSIF